MYAEPGTCLDNADGQRNRQENGLNYLAELQQRQGRNQNRRQQAMNCTRGGKERPNAPARFCTGANSRRGRICNRCIHK